MTSHGGFDKLSSITKAFSNLFESFQNIHHKLKSLIISRGETNKPLPHFFLLSMLSIVDCENEVSNKLQATD